MRTSKNTMTETITTDSINTSGIGGAGGEKIGVYALDNLNK